MTGDDPVFTVLADLRDRLTSARAELDAERTETPSGRLKALADGVTIAIGYVDEALGRIR